MSLFTERPGAVPVTSPFPQRDALMSEQTFHADDVTNEPNPNAPEQPTSRTYHFDGVAPAEAESKVVAASESKTVRKASKK